MLGQSIVIDETNTLHLKIFFYHENYGRHRFGRFVVVMGGCAILWVCHIRVKNLRCVSYDFLRLWGLAWAWQTFFGSIDRY